MIPSIESLPARRFFAGLHASALMGNVHEFYVTPAYVRTFLAQELLSSVQVVMTLRSDQLLTEEARMALSKTRTPEEVRALENASTDRRLENLLIQLNKTRTATDIIVENTDLAADGRFEKMTLFHFTNPTEHHGSCHLMLRLERFESGERRYGLFIVGTVPEVQRMQELIAAHCPDVVPAIYY